MTYGVTPDGFVRKTFATIQKEIQDFLRVKISKHLKLDEKTGLGNVVNGAAQQLDELWATAEKTYNAFDPDKADDVSKIALCALTGTKQKKATKGTVACACNLDGGRTYPPGALVAHVNGKPDNRWANRDTAVTTYDGSYSVIFEAENTGPIVAPAGQLTVIAQTAVGWNSVDNPVDATVGEDIETIDQIMARRELELGSGGRCTRFALQRDVSRVNGVLAVKIQENKTDYWGVLPPHSFRVIVWDGDPSAAENDDIAQAIIDNSVPTTNYGSLSGHGIDADGNAVSAKFDRVTAVPIYVAITVKGSGAGVAEAIVKQGKAFGVGGAVVLDKLRGVAVMLPNVIDCLAFTLGAAPSPSGTGDVPIEVDRIATFDVANVTVTVVP